MITVALYNGLRNDGPVEVFQALADPVRRRIVETLSRSDRPAGQLAQALHAEFGISQPATSRHLRVLRESGLAACAIHGTERHYSLNVESIEDAAAWLDDVRRFWRQRLDALDTELLNGGATTPPQDRNQEDHS